MAKTKQNGVKFKESEYHAKIQVKLLIVRFGSYGLLGLVLGLPWVLAFAIVFSDTSDDLWYPFVILQGLQVRFSLGANDVFIFFSFFPGRNNFPTFRFEAQDLLLDLRENHGSTSPKYQKASIIKGSWTRHLIDGDGYHDG